MSDSTKHHSALCSDMEAPKPSVWQNSCGSYKKIAIITAITGRMDEVKFLPEQIKESPLIQIDRHHFNDLQVPVELRKLNKRQQALYFKQQFFHIVPGYDVYIWIDGKIQVDSPTFVEQCLKALGDGELAILKHGERDCVYDELNYIIQKTEAGSEYFVRRFAYRLKILKRDMEFMRGRGYPEKAGLHDCSIMVWRNTEQNINLAGAWWATCKEYDGFDQVVIHELSHLVKQKIQPIVFEPGSFHLVKHLKVQ